MVTTLYLGVTLVRFMGSGDDDTVGGDDGRNYADDIVMRLVVAVVMVVKLMVLKGP